MSIKAVVAQSSVVAVPVTNQITDNGIITALSLENYVMFGMTFGAIFQILMLVSVFLIVLLNLGKLIGEANKLITSIVGLVSKRKRCE
ncbi:transmembrane helix containing protein [Shewanella phage vB_SspS_KASIA]|nr:transmembrane helix containing protein [Shewanella phage vB_SspS_KASIA]